MRIDEFRMTPSLKMGGRICGKHSENGLLAFLRGGGTCCKFH